MLSQYNFMFLKGPLGLIFGPSLGPSWNYLEAPLGSSRGQLGAVLGPPWAIPGPCCPLFGLSWALLQLSRVLWRSAWAILWVPWAMPGHLPHHEAIWSLTRGRQDGPERAQDGPKLGQPWAQTP